MDETIYEPGISPEAVTSAGDDDARRLKSFLSARNDEPEIREVHVHSLNDTVVLRELTERELSDWQSMFAQAPNSRSARTRTLVEQSAAMVAAALVSPRPTEQQLQDAGFLSLADMLRQSLRPVEVIKLGEVVMELSGGAEDAVEVAGN